MKEQHRTEHKSATAGLTEAQIARAQKRTEHGNALYTCTVATTSADWLHHSEVRGKLSSSERAAFDMEFIKARAIAGVRPAADLALAALMDSWTAGLTTPSWRRP